MTAPFHERVHGQAGELPPKPGPGTARHTQTFFPLQPRAFSFLHSLKLTDGKASVVSPIPCPFFPTGTANREGDRDTHFPRPYHHPTSSRHPSGREQSRSLFQPTQSGLAQYGCVKNHNQERVRAGLGRGRAMCGRHRPVRVTLRNNRWCSRCNRPCSSLGRGTEKVCSLPALRQLTV